jgi:hypothetical protein
MPPPDTECLQISPKTLVKKYSGAHPAVRAGDGIRFDNVEPSADRATNPAAGFDALHRFAAQDGSSWLSFVQISKK